MCGGVAPAVTKINVLPLFSRAEQLPFKIPVHVREDGQTTFKLKGLNSVQLGSTLLFFILVCLNEFGGKIVVFV